MNSYSAALKVRLEVILLIIINQVALKPQGKQPLVRSYTAEGHTKAVLSVQATDELLFSGSKG